MTATADRKLLDPLLILMVFGIVVAIAALAYPAFRADPMSAPGMILIVTVMGVSLFGLFAFGRHELRRPAADPTVDLLDALAEPAALVWPSGQVLAFNGAWAEAAGSDVALPKGPSAQALYMAFAQARAG
jgi:two-component system cell cycle sensor histidine kinase/response regulator CckA